MKGKEVMNERGWGNDWNRNRCSAEEKGGTISGKHRCDEWEGERAFVTRIENDDTWKREKE